MPTDVVMPQMGESVAEGTVVRWIKQVGDTVDRDEPLFEISTDKVDAEIPAPAAGVLLEIRTREGETVPVDSVVAVIGQPGEAVGTAPAESTASVPSGPETATAPRPADATPSPVPPSPPPAPTPAPAGASAAGDDLARRRQQKSSPLVRRIAKEHDVDLSRVTGSGIGGRVTKKDILAFLEKRGEAPAAAAAPAVTWHVPAYSPGERVEVVPMSVMRRKIAEHMIASQQISAHVYSVVEVDYTQVAKIRAAKQAEYERHGARLTYLAFIAKATVDALRAVPVVNAAVDGDRIVYKKDVGLGIAVALDWGLIVPVIRAADEKNLLGLSRAIQDLAARARTKQLKPEEVQGGTFTITNPGVFGTLLGMPIINQPQVGILGVGAIEKRVVVIDDAIAIRQRGYLTLGYDHRLVDGAVADEFLSHLRRGIEGFDPAAA